ncbi:hypothetical protein KI387_011983, partial [Taxus chinensis]
MLVKTGRGSILVWLQMIILLCSIAVVNGRSSPVDAVHSLDESRLEAHQLMDE